MSGKRMCVCAGCVILALVGMNPIFGADENKDAPKKDGGPGGGGPGAGGRGGGGRGGGGFPMMGRGNMQWMEGMLNRGLGIEQTAKVEDLPFGEERRLVRDVPVGGVDGLQTGRDGWKVESVFTLTPEQVQALETLREDYKKELANLQTEYDAAQKALAEKVKTLRLLYETKANDVLTDPAKAEKLKLDALVKEFAAQNGVQVKERTAQIGELRANLEKTMEEARKNNDWGNLREAFGKVHTVVNDTTEQRTNLAKDFNEKMKETVTGAAQEKLAELLKQQNTNPWQGGGHDRGGAPGGGNRGGQRGGGAEPPPAPPAGTEF